MSLCVFLSVSQIFGFIATIVFALDFYLIFNELANFLKDGRETNEATSRQQGKQGFLLALDPVAEVSRGCGLAIASSWS